MADAPTAAIGMESTSFQLLIQIMRQLGEISATQAGMNDRLNDVHNNTTRQLSELQERVGRSETLNEVQNERLKQVENDRDALKVEVLRLKAEHHAEVEAMRNDFNRELEKVRSEQREDERTRWMIRGGMMVVAVAWPIIWQLVILPMFAR